MNDVELFNVPAIVANVPDKIKFVWPKTPPRKVPMRKLGAVRLDLSVAKSLLLFIQPGLEPIAECVPFVAFLHKRSA